MESKKAYEKVKDYLIDEVGNMALPGSPTYDSSACVWRVPVLCKTEKGIFAVGEIQLDRDLNFVHIPSKKQMLKTLEIKMRQVPVLVYGDPAEMRKKGLKPVTV